MEEKVETLTLVKMKNSMLWLLGQQMNQFKGQCL